jgi:hypothetical protein
MSIHLHATLGILIFMTDKNEVLKYDGERRVMALLAASGRTVKRMAQNGSPYDLLVDGKLRIEVKTSRPNRAGRDSQNPRWCFNIHRHNQLNESHVDLYVLRFEGIPLCSAAMHAAFRAPLGKATLLFGMKALLEGCASEGVRLFRELKNGTLSR